MRKLLLTIGAVCLGAVGFGSPAIAGISFDCATSGDTNLTDYFCNGTDLYEVNLHCWNLDADIEGFLEINGDLYNFEVIQDYELGEDFWDWVCDQEGYYIDSDKTEVKCTDAGQGSNKPDKNKDDGFDEAGFEIKNLGYDASCAF